MTKYLFNSETRYNSEIKNESIKSLVDKNKLSKEDGIDLEIFFANTNLSSVEKDYITEFLDKVACS